jgi:hypothetical protein
MGRQLLQHSLLRQDLLQFLRGGARDHRGELLQEALAGGGIQGHGCQPLLRTFPEHLAMRRGVLVLGANGGEIADGLLAGLPVAPDTADQDGFARDIPAAPKAAVFPADEHGGFSSV